MAIRVIQQVWLSDKVQSWQTLGRPLRLSILIGLHDPQNGVRRTLDVDTRDAPAKRFVIEHMVAGVVDAGQRVEPR